MYKANYFYLNVILQETDDNHHDDFVFHVWRDKQKPSLPV